MKSPIKIIAFVSFASLMLLQTCNSPTPTGNNNEKTISNLNIVSSEFYEYNGVVYTIDFIFGEDSILEPVHSEALDLAEKIMSHQSACCLINSANDTVSIDTSFEALKNKVVYKSILAKTKVFTGVTFYTNSDYQGNAFNAPSLVPHMSAYGFNDNISSFKMYGYGALTIYENADYGGHVLIFNHSSGVPDYYISNLKDHCMTRFIFCTKTWNDQISSTIY